jgi:hypothetical protein
MQENRKENRIPHKEACHYKIISLLFLFSSMAFALESEIAKTSASFLRIGVGARPYGMAGAFYAVSDDLHAIYYNTAGLSQIKKNQITLMYNKWTPDTLATFLGHTRPIGQGGIGFGLIWFDSGEFERRDEDGILLPTKFRPYNLAYILGLGYPIFSGISCGSSLIFIQEKIDKDRTDGHSLNFDILYINGRMRTGFGLKNIGKGIKGFSLPKELKIGIAYKEEGLIISGDITLPEDSDGKINIGTEYQNDIISLRMGWEQLFKREGLTRLGFRGGFGVRIKGMKMDFAIIPQGDFGNASCVSVGFDY